MDPKSIYTAHAPPEMFIRPILATHVQRLVETYVQMAPASASILDAGCGRQPLRPWLESRGLAYFSLDHNQNESQTVDLVEAIDAKFLEKYPDFGPFDFILCTEVMEHVPNWSQAFENFYRLCKTEGCVFITCPQVYQLHEEPYDYWRPTPYALEYFAQEAGFQVLENIKAGDAWDVLGTILNSTQGLYYRSQRVTWHDRIKLRLLSWVKKWLSNQLNKHRVQERIGLYSPLYLSNICVLKK